MEGKVGEIGGNWCQNGEIGEIWGKYGGKWGGNGLKFGGGVGGSQWEMGGEGGGGGEWKSGVKLGENGRKTRKGHWGGGGRVPYMSIYGQKPFGFGGGNPKNSRGGDGGGDGDKDRAPPPTHTPVLCPSVPSPRDPFVCPHPSHYSAGGRGARGPYGVLWGPVGGRGVL